MSAMTADGLGRGRPESDAPITGEKRLTLSVPLDGIDGLLIAASEADPAATLEQRVSALLQAAGTALSGYALGAVIPSRSGEPLVLRFSARDKGDAGHDPTRLFPDHAVERVVSIDADSRSTLHVASDDDEQEPARASVDTMIERLALTLRGAVRHANLYETLRDQVIQSEKLASLGQIAAGVVHELNNPLTSILAYSDYLRRKGERSGFDPADLERLGRIHEAADRILRFSRDLVAYSRPSTETPCPLSIHDVIDRALVFCEHLLDSTGVTVDKDFGEIPPVLGVPGPLTQVFVNLFTNAAHAMDESGGSLSISTTSSSDEDRVTVVIRDDGHGIDTEHLPRIFDPFFTTKTDGSGTGLGLSIVRSIITAHGGDIRADTGEPRGTIFYVALPIATLQSMPRR